MKKIVLFGLWVCCSFLSAAEVIKISKNKMNMAVSSEMSGTLELGQKVCVQNKQGKSYCGTVIKVRSEGAICKMSAPLNGVAVGDAVEAEGGESLSGSSEEGLTESKPEGKLSSRPEPKGNKPGAGFGIKAGLALSNISSDNQAYNASTNRKGLTLGVVIDFPIGQTRRFSLETGLRFLQAGYEMPTYSVHGNVIEFPLLLKTRLVQGDISPTFFVGPYLTYLLSANYVDLTGEVDVKKIYNKMDIGLVGGLGIEIKVGEAAELGLSGSYALGFSNINNESVSMLTEVDKTRRLQFLAHLIFR